MIKNHPQDFGTKVVDFEGIKLSCAYKVPGLTMHDLVMIFEAATKEAKPEDEYSANPAKWPTVRGVEAVVDAVMDAIHSSQP